MQPDITIQPIGNAWSPQVIGLILPIQQLEFHVPTTLEKQPDLLDIDGSYHAPGGGFWGAISNDQLVGTIGLINIGQFGVIRKMFVHKDYRSCGIAQLLLDALITHAQTTGIQDLYLGTIHTMEAAARFYIRNGFTRIGKSSLPHGFPLMAVDDTFYHRNTYL